MDFFLGGWGGPRGPDVGGNWKGSSCRRWVGTKNICMLENTVWSFDQSPSLVLNSSLHYKDLKHVDLVGPMQGLERLFRYFDFSGWACCNSSHTRTQKTLYVGYKTNLYRIIAKKRKAADLNLFQPSLVMALALTFMDHQVRFWDILTFTFNFYWIKVCYVLKNARYGYIYEKLVENCALVRRLFPPNLVFLSIYQYVTVPFQTFSAAEMVIQVRTCELCIDIYLDITLLESWLPLIG